VRPTRSPRSSGRARRAAVPSLEAWRPGGRGRAALDKLAWSGACDALAGDRRTGAVVARRRRAGRQNRRGTQLALPLDLPAPPKLQALSAWDEMIADYETTGSARSRNPSACCASAWRARRGVTRDLERLAHRRRVRIGGLVVARQRPGTAKGVAFLLLEDEFGTLNLVVPPTIYERDRLAVRSEPLVIAEGRLERFASAGGAINVVCDRLLPLEAPGKLAAEVKELGKNFAIVGGEEEEPQVAAAGGGGADFRAVAPPVLSFTQGRKR
jgi:error-prone DNA polymerase